MNSNLRAKIVSILLIILIIANAALATFAYRTTKQLKLQQGEAMALRLQQDQLIADYIDSLILAFGKVDNSIKWMYYRVGGNEPEPRSMYNLTVYLMEIYNTLNVGQRCVDQTINCSGEVEGGFGVNFGHFALVLNGEGNRTGDDVVVNFGYHGKLISSPVPFSEDGRISPEERALLVELCETMGPMLTVLRNVDRAELRASPEKARIVLEDFKKELNAFYAHWDLTKETPLDAFVLQQ